MEFKCFNIDVDFLTKHWLHQVSWPVTASHNIQMDILRLDRIHPLISGNKWLKLQGWLEKFRDKGLKGIVTAGGPWSNFLHACGYACHTNSIPLHVLVKGHSHLNNPMLNDLKNWKTEITFVNRHQLYDKTFGLNLAQDKGFGWIPMGGDGTEGEKGVERWMNRLPLATYDIVCCATGTGTTAAGIAKSQMKFRELWVFDPGTGDASVPKKFTQLQNHLPHRSIRFFALNGAFGKLNRDLEAFMLDWYHQTAIPLDFVYTAPMFRAWADMIAGGLINTGNRILFVHSGGLQGNRSYPALPTA